MIKDKLFIKILTESSEIYNTFIKVCTFTYHLAKKFSVLSWNVKNFTTKNNNVKKIVEHIKNQDPPEGPDVMAIYEVKGKDVFATMMKEFPNHMFFITEGIQVQEILVGIKNKFTAFITQRTEFKSKISTLRPGTLVTLHIDDKNYSLLFLHTKSFPDPVGFGLRDDQLKQAFELKKKLDSIAGGKGEANMIITGDLNTMGLDYRAKGNDILFGDEIDNLAKNANNRVMKILSKDNDETWAKIQTKNKKKFVNFGQLDHVIASKQLQFNKINEGDSDVRVSGWKEHLTKPDKTNPNPALQKFLDEISDHNSLYFEVQ